MRHLLKEIEEILFTGQWGLSPLQSKPLGTSDISPRVSYTVQNSLQNPLLESSSLGCLAFFPWVSLPVWNPVKGHFSFWEKPEVAGCQNLAVGWLNREKNIKAFGIIQIVSVEEFSSLTHNLMQIRCSTCSVIWNAADAQYTRSINCASQCCANHFHSH